MTKLTNGGETSSPAWDTLEAFTRAQVQGFIQQLLEDEVDELLGRIKSERRYLGPIRSGRRMGHLALHLGLALLLTARRI